MHAAIVPCPYGVNKTECHTEDSPGALKMTPIKSASRGPCKPPCKPLAAGGPMNRPLVVSGATAAAVEKSPGPECAVLALPPATLTGTQSDYRYRRSSLCTLGSRQ